MPRAAEEDGAAFFDCKSISYAPRACNRKTPRCPPGGRRDAQTELQPREIPMRRATVSISQDSGTNLVLPAMSFSGFEVTILSVSYTHLDVYKRQALH